MGDAGSTGWGLRRRREQEKVSKERIVKRATIGGGCLRLHLSESLWKAPASALSFLSDGDAGEFIYQLGQYVIWKLLPGGKTQKFWQIQKRGGMQVDSVTVQFMCIKLRPCLWPP